MSDGLTADEEARLLALVGVGPRSEWRGTLDSWIRTHDTDALLRFAVGQGWYVSLHRYGGADDWHAAVGIPIGAGQIATKEWVYGVAGEAWTALGLALLAVEDDG